MIKVFTLVSQKNSRYCDECFDKEYEGLFLSLEEVIKAIKNDIHEFMDNPDKTFELSEMNSELIGHGMAVEPKCGFTYSYENNYYWVFQYEINL